MIDVMVKTVSASFLLLIIRRWTPSFGLDSLLLRDIYRLLDEY